MYKKNLINAINILKQKKYIDLSTLEDSVIDAGATSIPNTILRLKQNDTEYKFLVRKYLEVSKEYTSNEDYGDKKDTLENLTTSIETLIQNMTPLEIYLNNFDRRRNKEDIRNKYFEVFKKLQDQLKRSRNI